MSEIEGIVPAPLLPLLDEAFVSSCKLIEQYTNRLASRVFRDLELDRACAEFVAVDTVVATAGLASDAHVPTQWLLETLTGFGQVERLIDANGIARFRTRSNFQALDSSELLAQQREVDARCLPAYNIAALAADRYPAVLRGELKGEQALFSPDTFDAWCDYFSNDNPLYAIANAIGAILVERHLAGDAHSILEIGGGLGSGAHAVWRRLEMAQRTHAVDTYRFTEISGIFLRRAQKTLRPAFPDAPFGFAKLDIDQPFADAGVAPSSCTLIYGVNVLHVAHDLAATLDEIRKALTPNGTLIISECVRPFAGRPVYVEFVFNLLESFRSPVLVPGWRPNGGFLTPEQWRAALEANGFKDVCFLPDISRVRDIIPAFVVAGISAKPA